MEYGHNRFLPAARVRGVSKGAEGERLCSIYEEEFIDIKIDYPQFT
ncbi:hypothetical protein ACT7DD_18885 [Bacillus paranthracis]